MSSVIKNKLRQRLDSFYATVPDYLAFQSASNQMECWAHVETEIRKRMRRMEGPCRVLEVGAGRSGFGAWLAKRNLRENVLWTAQDVINGNETWLRSQADAVVLGDISTIRQASSYDIIFSTYVLEHVTNPEEHLNCLHSLLLPGGKLYIFCPRYDMPGYVCPSTRHLRAQTRFGFVVTSACRRLRSSLTQKPCFLIQTDLAAFHLPFFLDADAVHWVSLLDLRLWAKRNGGKSKRLGLGNPKIFSKDWFVKRMLTCAVEITKSPVPVLHKQKSPVLSEA